MIKTMIYMDLILWPLVIYINRAMRQTLKLMALFDGYDTLQRCKFS